MSRRRPPSKRLVGVVEYAKSHGWTWSITRGGHVKFSKPGKPPVFASATPSDHRSEQATISDLRRADRRGTV